MSIIMERIIQRDAGKYDNRQLGKGVGYNEESDTKGDNMEKLIRNQQFDEERALYGIRDTRVQNCIFDGPADGESAFKECSEINVEDCYFNLRYPFWHVHNAVIKHSKMTEGCRAALWYDDAITIEDSELHGIKAFRECRDIKVRNCDLISPEVFWRCDKIRIHSVKLESEYPFFESKNVTIDQLTMKGKYSFQYVENMTITNSNLDTKDAFWHSKNVTVTDSVVKGEYLGWYSENLKLVRCKIIGTQPLCYCKGLILEDCTMEETDLSFERSEVEAKVIGRIEGIKNPLRGTITADEIGDLLMEPQYVNPEDTVITLRNT